LLDVGMPDLDGYEVARRLRALDWPKRLGIITKPARIPPTIRLAMEAGADDIIFKPILRQADGRDRTLATGPGPDPAAKTE
jgi:CheY-like chemotaxis protein